MHKNKERDCLTAVITAQEAAQMWGLSRNAVSDACRRGALRGRKSEHTWLVTIGDMVVYQKGRYPAAPVPVELKSTLAQALVRLQDQS